LLQRALVAAELPADTLQVIADPDQRLGRTNCSNSTNTLSGGDSRGGAALHRFCVEHATMPVIVGGIGIVHAYIDHTANPTYVRDIVVNGRVQRPSVC
jgi:glutamate-5-semialdehyde dehydrogenase